MSRDLLTNERIRAREVRVVTESGKQLGVMPTIQALEKAREIDLDLILVAPEGKPPVCRIANYGKLRYELRKKEKKSRKGQKTGTLKELKFSVKISEHDYQVRFRKSRELLEKGHKVKATMAFRGREVTHPELGEKILRRLTEEVKDLGAPERPPRREGRFMNIILVPK